MKLIKTLCLGLVITALLGMGNAFADGKNVIAVTGTAFSEVKPDMATVNMRVEAKGETSPEVREALAAKIAKVQQALAFAGVNGDKVKTGQYNITSNVIYRRNGQRQTIGYKGNCTFTAQVEEIDKIGTVVDRLGNISQVQITSVNYGLLHREEIERKLLAQATANAKEKASIVATAGGRTLGSLISADIDSQGGSRVNMTYAVNDLARSGGAKMTSTQLSPGTMKLTAYVRTQWSLQ